MGEMVTTYRDLVPTSTTITRGVRMALVYRLGMVDYSVDDFPRPCNLNDGIDAFKRIAHMPLHTLQRIAAPADFLRFEFLEGLDTSLVDKLLATEPYDTAFAQESPEDDVSDDYDDEEDNGYEPKIENEVAVCMLHPRCQIHADVVAARIGSCVDAVLNDSTPMDYHLFECPPVALVFWLERYRCTLLGLDAVLPLVTESIANNTMDQYGRRRLAPAICGLLSRWYQAPPSRSAFFEDIPIDSAPRLLASLAGITKDAVFPRLDQPFVCEPIKGCYHHALDQHRLLPENDSNPEMLCWFATHVVLLDWYIDEGAPNAAGGNYLSTFLPPSMILAVESFLYVRHLGTLTLMKKKRMARKMSRTFPKRS
ncbi:hypothetical protein SDRG_10420 [Saprolegnia diclina VS20]|uniref:Uncharacterized protein n=1 Tax=Saprolegnia diclina (strain VS20) TaxID=1156394 RepID=T0RP79_SAPDV|nr:hypothetical protein SDRG_10420 [Saprolegnia diclina VS20]EQC31902.1 hypothetical protein SDRG_10420 [Saprolegnia diclina VS20]|eukprot:XP_008614630.1 hypothetical protein SDRG_10420 [Saprolegnia diclina VS20]